MEKVYKKRILDLNSFAPTGCKIAAAKKLFFTDLCYLFTRFKRLFAPTSQSLTSKLFRYLELLGKIYKKKWSQIVKLLLIMGVKSPRKRSFFFCEFCLTSRIFGIGATICIGREMLCLPYVGFLYPSYWRVQNGIIGSTPHETS